MSKDKRFIKAYSQGAISYVEVWIDREFGVNFMFVHDCNAVGLTVLMDKDGKPVITPVSADYEE